MEFSKFLNSSVKLNIILLISFSISVNSFILFPNINNVFYILFHLTFIYFLFYHYHYSIYFLGLIYGIMLDIFLINEIGSHLLVLIFLISIFILFKKYLFLLNSNQITIIIFVTLIVTIFLIGILAYLLNNINFSFQMMLNYSIISLIIFIPSIFFFNNLDK